MGQKWLAWTDKGVTLDGNGNAVFTVVEENGLPVSSQLQTGYNFMDEPVVKTTFGDDDLQWRIGKLHKPLFEHFLHTGGYGLDRVSVGVGEKTDIDKTVFHRFGVL